MVGTLYAVLGALLLVRFSFDVVRLRMQYRAVYGDDSFSELQSVIRIHGNAVEYIPVATVLMLFTEVSGAETWMVYIRGIVLFTDRLIHRYGFHHRLFHWRRSDMSATWCALLLTVLTDLWCIPWELAFSLRQRAIRHLLSPGFLRYVSPRHAIFCPHRQAGRLDLR